MTRHYPFSYILRDSIRRLDAERDLQVYFIGIYVYRWILLSRFYLAESLIPVLMSTSQANYLECGFHSFKNELANLRTLWRGLPIKPRSKSCELFC